MWRIASRMIAVFCVMLLLAGCVRNQDYDITETSIPNSEEVSSVDSTNVPVESSEEISEEAEDVESEDSSDAAVLPQPKPVKLPTNITYLEAGVAKHNAATAKYEEGIVRLNNITLTKVDVRENCYYYTIDGLKDEAVEEAINNRIYSVFYEMYQPEFLPPYRGIVYRVQAHPDGKKNAYVTIEGNYNNLLSVRVIQYQEGTYGDLYSCAVPLNFNLETGEELKLEDLFYEGEDYMGLLNAEMDTFIWENVSLDEEPEGGCYGEEYRDKIRLTAPFESIRQDHKFFLTQEGDLKLMFDYETPEFYLNYSTLYVVPNLDNFTAFAGISDADIFEDNAFRYRFNDQKTFPGDIDGTYDVRELKEKAYLQTNQGDYGELPADILELYTNVQAVENWTERFEGTYRQLTEEAERPEWLLEIDLYCEIFSYGNYVNFVREYREFGYYGERSEPFMSEVFYVDFMYYTECYKRDTLEKVEIDDLFTEGTDAKEAIARAMEADLRKSFIENKELVPSDQDIAEYIDLMITHMNGFGLEEERISIYTDLSSSEQNELRDNLLGGNSRYIWDEGAAYECFTAGELAIFE